MTPQSGKAKGRRLQQHVCARIKEELGCPDAESRSMGAGGEDVILSTEDRRRFPYSVECKAVERLNVWQSLSQASANASEHIPLLIFKKNRSNVYACLPLEDLLRLQKELNTLKGISNG